MRSLQQQGSAGKLRLIVLAHIANRKREKRSLCEHSNVLLIHLKEWLNIREKSAYLFPFRESNEMHSHVC